jgi:anti-repressor protein
LNQIKLFSNDELEIQVRTILNEDGSISINAEDTAIGFGWTQTQNKNGKEYTSIRWETLNSYCSDFGFLNKLGKEDYIPESLFYMLGMKAGNERALKYQRWLAIEVLPSLRKHGMYAIDEIINNPDLAIQALTALKEERDKNKQLVTEVKVKTQLIGELKPKADYVDRILQNQGLVTITQIAKDYGMSGQAMNELLHELKVQFKQSGQWLLYSEYHDMGYTHSKTVDITHKDGTLDVKMNTKWTQKGRLFLYELLKNNGYLPVIEQSKTA